MRGQSTSFEDTVRPGDALVFVTPSEFLCPGGFDRVPCSASRADTERWIDVPTGSLLVATGNAELDRFRTPTEPDPELFVEVVSTRGLVWVSDRWVRRAW